MHACIIDTADNCKIMYYYVYIYLNLTVQIVVVVCSLRIPLSTAFCRRCRRFPFFEKSLKVQMFGFSFLPRPKRETVAGNDGLRRNVIVNIVGEIYQGVVFSCAVMPRPCWSEDHIQSNFRQSSSNCRERSRPFLPRWAESSAVGVETVRISVQFQSIQIPG